MYTYMSTYVCNVNVQVYNELVSLFTNTALYSYTGCIENEVVLLHCFNITIYGIQLIIQ